MNFTTHTLKPPLEVHIESMFHFDGFMPDHSIERMVPTGHVYIIFELDGITRNTFDNETLKPNNTYSKVWVSGMHKHYISISVHPDSEMLGIQFKPCGAYPFLHSPIHNMNDTVFSAEEIFGSDILKLREAILKQITSPPTTSPIR